MFNKRLVPALLLLLPRSSLAYPFYFFASFLSVRYSLRDVALLKFVTLIAGAFFILNSFVAKVSPVSFLMSLVMNLPMFMFAMGFSFKASKEEFFKALRWINVIVLLFSILNLIEYGFPFKLPYLDFLPDHYSAFFGLGGAKIVTVIGFFGLVFEVYYKVGRQVTTFAIVALINFMLPNYLLGMACGLLSILAVSIKRVRVLFFIGVLLALVSQYAFMRWLELDKSMMAFFGYHPKIYAYSLCCDLFLAYPFTLVIGTGLGQFSSTSALWASEYVSRLSTHTIPSIDGFFMSSYHGEAFRPFFEYAMSNIWYVSSSFNKPYTSISGILAEVGLPLTVFLGLLFFRSFKEIMNCSEVGKVLFIFVVCLFFVDVWHDNPWLGFLLLGLRSLCQESSDEKNISNPGAA